MRIFGIKFERNSLLYWLLPYIVCILISVMLSSISYYQAIRVISEQTKKAHEESVVAISDKIEPMLSSASFAMMQIISGGHIEAICSDSPLFGGYDYYTYGQLQSELQDAGNLSEIVKGEYVYFTGSKYMLSENNLYDGEQIGTLFSDEMGLSKSDIKLLLDSREAVTYHLLPSSKGTQAFLVHAIPNRGSYEDGAVVIFSLDTSVFLDSLSIHSQTKGRFAAIIDRNNTMLLSGTWPDRRIVFQSNDGTVQNIEYGIGSGRIVASAIASDASGWEYVTGLPYSILMEKMNHILVYIFAFVFLGVFAGVAAAYYFARRSYTSMDHLMRKFMDSLSISRRDGYSFEGLEKILENLISERRNLDRSFEKYKNAARDNVLMKLLGGSSIRLSEIMKTLKELNVDLRGGRTILLVFSVDDFSHVFFDEKADEDETIFELINLIISNVVGELANKDYPSYMTEFMGYQVCLINIKERNNEIEPVLKKIAENSIDFIRTNFGMMLSAMISRECSNLEEIHPAFTEAIGYFDLFDHGNTVYTISDVKAMSDPPAEDRLAGTEIREKLHKDLEDEIDRLFTKDAQVHKRLKTAVRKLQLPAAGQPAAETAEEPEDNPAAVRWAQEISEYIDSNYADQALNISFLAYRFNMNPAYIGRRYKEVTGAGLLEYIHRRRLEEAEKLIGQGLHMKEVAERVGFSNTLTMRRAFERYKEENPEISVHNSGPMQPAG